MKRIFPALLVLAALLFPFFFRDYWLYVGIIGLYYAILASSWSMLAGQVGLISFAHAAFAGIGTSAFGVRSVMSTTVSTSQAYIATGSSLFSPIRKAGVGVVAESSTSACSKACSN